MEFFAVCDSAAFGCIHVIKKSGLKVPHDVAVVGFTNEPMAEIIEPSLTSIAQPVNRIGQTAAKNVYSHDRRRGGLRARNTRFENGADHKGFHQEIIY